MKLLKYEYIHIPKVVNRGYKHINTLKGFPDFAIFMPLCKTIFVELKTDIGKLSKEQVDKKIKLEKCGFKYYIIRDFENFEKLFKGL